MANMTVYLDGQHYQYTRFENCTLVYSGGVVPTLLGNQFLNCTWRVEGAASNTLDFFKLLTAIGGADIVQAAIGLPRA